MNILALKMEASWKKTLAILAAQLVSSLFLLSVSSIGAHAASESRYSKGMHVVITGTGWGPHAAIQGGSGVAVIIDGKLLQFDAGPKTQEHLSLAGVLPKHKIDALFFTHLHPDHTTDFVSMRGWPFPVFNKGYRIFGPPSTKAMTQAASDFHAMHDKELDAAAVKWPVTASHIQEYRVLRFPIVEEITPPGGVVLDADDIKVTAAITPHMLSEGGYSFAYRVDSRYGSVAISGDTVPSLDVVRLAKGADILVHEATMPDREPEANHTQAIVPVKLGDSMAHYKTNNQAAHSTPTEIGKVAKRAKVKKLVTYHSGPFVQDEPQWLSDFYGKKEPEKKKALIAAIRKNYDGPIVVGKALMVFEIGKTINETEQN